MFANAPAQQITLSKAIDEAMQHNLELQQQQKRVMQADAYNQSGVGWFLPKVSVNAGYTWFNQDMELNMGMIKPTLDELAGVYGATIAKDLGLSGGTQDEIYHKIVTGLGKLPDDNIAFDFNQFPNASISAVQPLFTGGKIISAKNTAGVTSNISRLELTGKQNIITKKVVDEYYMVVLLQDIVRTRELAVQDMQLHAKNTQRLIETGVLSKYNKLRAEVALATAERHLADDQSRLDIARSALNISIGFPEDTVLVLQDSLYFKLQNISVEKLQQDARRDLPVFQLQQQKRQLVEQNYNAQRAEMFPQIFAFANYSFFNNQLPIVMGPFTAGIQLHYNIFNGMSDYKKLQAGKYMMQEANLSVENTEVKVDFLIDKSYKQVEAAKNRYLKLQSTIKLAEENYRISKKRFDQGLDRSVDVIDAYTLLETARVEQLLALYAYYVALNNLYFASGQTSKIATVLR
jgi:outer membrane protein TolC